MSTELSKLNDCIKKSAKSPDSGRKGLVLAIQGMCPYLLKMKDKQGVSCECAKFKFPDKVARREIVYSFCAHPTNFKDCVFKQVLDRYYYERKFADAAYK